MNIRFDQLVVQCKRNEETIRFLDFNYFYGQMGAGKSSIARLVDFCLGGDLEVTPAMQSEFVSASVRLHVGDVLLTLQRDLGANNIHASWQTGNEPWDVLIPARVSQGVVLADTQVEVLSDLVFHLAGRVPPKVRRGQETENCKLVRLSMRNLMWYCYLDQETLDSSFFNLDDDANPFKRVQSRDVLRYVLGYHQEQVAELEADLDVARSERDRCETAAKAVNEALATAHLGTEVDVAARRSELQQTLQQIDAEIGSIRQANSPRRPHAVDGLQSKGRSLAAEIEVIERALADLAEVLAEDKRHKNEILSLEAKFKRSQSARAVLSGVEYADCPRCGSRLPQHQTAKCCLCGQDEQATTHSEAEDAVVTRDIDARVQELDEIIAQHAQMLSDLRRKLSELQVQKKSNDADLDRASVEYDSAFLSSALEAERRRAKLQQEVADLANVELLLEKVRSFEQTAQRLAGEECSIRTALKHAREKAERDAQNLNKLKRAFLDCLVSARIPGFAENDVVEMRAPHFLPEISGFDTGDLAVTSFSNLGSGGKKTLFKCCFALALHRVAAEIGAPLPSFLIMDSPMKNTSERENRLQFQGFYDLLYRLAATELSKTQIILIDKELYAPPTGFTRSFSSRHMTPDNDSNPPLISYYRGK